mmetsp:Transcript_106882/g.189953  ORF Transcript_106882/g.189953 Transcript_106882/m.189953 type:complete len:336 (+) Transcript_106882:72-1079(+)
MEQPAVGLGTLGLNETATAAVTEAVAAGCRLIDTGEHYGNLNLIGAGLKNHRDEQPFIITKLSGLPVGDYGVVRARVEDMLKRLGVTRVHLCLIHWPGLCTWDPTEASPLASPADFSDKASTWEQFSENIAEAWQNMRKLQSDGLVGEVGTSNFYAHHLQELALKANGAVPFANEIFINAENQETQFVADMQHQGIKVLAYRPVAYKPFSNGVESVAKRTQQSPQVVSLAWLLKRGVWPLVKCRGEHIQQNVNEAALLCDQLTAEDLDLIARDDVGLKFHAEWFAKLWSAHNTAGTVSEDEVQMLVAMGVEESKAREVLVKCNGNIDEAMDAAFD